MHNLTPCGNLIVDGFAPHKTHSRPITDAVGVPKRASYAQITWCMPTGALAGNTHVTCYQRANATTVWDI